MCDAVTYGLGSVTAQEGLTRSHRSTRRPISATDGRRTALQAARGAGGQLPHEQPEIEAAHVHEAGCWDGCRDARGANGSYMRVRPEQLAALPQQPLPPRAANPPAIGVDRVTGRRRLPVAPLSGSERNYARRSHLGDARWHPAGRTASTCSAAVMTVSRPSRRVAVDPPSISTTLGEVVRLFEKTIQGCPCRDHRRSQTLTPSDEWRRRRRTPHSRDCSHAYRAAWKARLCRS